MTAEHMPSATPSAEQMRLIKRLTEAVAISGNEGAVRAIVREQVEPYVDELRVDTLGNLLIRCKGRSSNGVRVMLAAHMDEVGLMVTGAADDGTLRCKPVGWVDAAQFLGKPVWIGRHRLPGVVGAPPTPGSAAGASANPAETMQIRIDIGAMSKEEAAGKVRLGEQVVFATELTRLGPMMRAKALDDRLGIAILIEIVQCPPAEIDLLAAFTVQEEIGLRGAEVAAHRMEPDLAIAIDCAPARDLPTRDGEENTRYSTRLGGGPAVYVADRLTICDPRIVRLLTETAEQQGIPYQLRQPGEGGTDAGAIHLSRAGVPSVSVSVPTRYTHSPASYASIADWRATVRLLHAAVRRLGSSLLEDSPWQH